MLRGPAQTHAIRRLLIANRGEIAIRVMRAANELNIVTVAIYSAEDRFSLHRTKADESYQVGVGKSPIDAYLDINDIIRIATDSKCDAIHPGYGFLSENPDFASACASNGLVFVGPNPEILRLTGNKIAAKELAEELGIPVVRSHRIEHKTLLVQENIQYPVMIKACFGGGGKGIKIVNNPAELAKVAEVASRIANSYFGNGALFVEQYGYFAAFISSSTLVVINSSTVSV